jgi:hypothetical protein
MLGDYLEEKVDFKFKLVIIEIFKILKKNFII